MIYKLLLNKKIIINYVFPLSLLVVVFFSSCDKQEQLRKSVMETIDKEIVLIGVKGSNESEFKIVRYVEKPSCTSCQLQCGQWKVYRRKLKRKYGDRVSINFIINTDNVKEAQKVLAMNKFEDISCIDIKGEFKSKNNLNGSLGKDIVMLLNKNNRVLCIGNPCNDLKIDSLYQVLINAEQ